MVTKAANLNGTHTSGIYADMTVDGPDIGTLVVVVDRAKNLPNRRTMGKQDPYCAARLGKEAKKTNTDRRGGQTPRWDQELRFTVRDSPDYQNLKVSVFNDDKKTELIGETWVSLTEIVVAGGGQSDAWHNLSCRGKYSGELRMEFTYYDSRPKPEKSDGPAHTSVKRRPLSSNPECAQSLPPGFGSEPRPLPSTTGPRDFGTPSRRQMQPHSISAGNTPLRQGHITCINHEPEVPDHGRPLPEQISDQQSYQYSSQPVSDVYPAERDAYYSDASVGEVGPSHSGSLYNDDPIGLPELPPMDNSRHSRFVRGITEPAPDRYTVARDQDHAQLHHSYSAPLNATLETQRSDHTPMPGLGHTQSDSVLIHGQPIGQPFDPYQKPESQSDPYRSNHKESTLVSGVEDHGQTYYQTYNGTSQYNDSFDLSSLAHPNTYETRHHSLPPELPDLGAPPPPVHRSHGSTPSILTHGDARSAIPDDFTPAPLNISSTKFPRASTRDTSSKEYRSETASSPYHDPSFGIPPHDDPYYSSPFAYAPNDMVRASDRPKLPFPYAPNDVIQASSRPELPSDTPPPLYDYDELRQDSSSDSHHRIHRNSLSQPHDPYRNSIYDAETQSGMVTPSRESHMSAPYSQQSSPIVSDRISPYSQEQSSPLTKYTPPHRQTPPRPYTMYGSPASGSYQLTSNYNTPPRRHPLSQQQNATNIGSNYQQYSSPPVTTDEAPIIKPRPISPDPGQARLSYRITPTTRKSMSPRSPNQSERRSSDVPFGPDSYDQFNPGARKASSIANDSPANGPHTPMRSGPNSAHRSPYTKDDGPILDFHGNTIDPSDRLPESSWAPEPEKKVAIKIKPQRERERLNGARPSPDSTTAALSFTKPSPKDNQPKPQNPPNHSTSPLTTSPLSSLHTSPTALIVSRNKLRKLHAPATTSRPHSLSFPSPVAGETGVTTYGSGAGVPPPIPAKIPLDEGRGDDMMALSEEMRRIDIGSVGAGRRRRLLGFGG